VSGVPEKMVGLHRALEDAALPHAFGGALALAWCTERARGTIDIDVNVFTGADRVDDVLASLPAGMAWTARDRSALVADGQQRLWWDGTPVDVFLNTTAFHDEVAGRARFETFEGEQLPFLGCSDLAVFKAFFNRTRDWADLEEMRAAGTLDVDRVAGILARYRGPDDERIERLLRL